ncbi:MAG: glycosyltransferase family 2 protein [Microscillaceae bacterium]|nr:glycosyltransferase family 2 protein [Microscillaceae bacterium]
MKPPQISVCIAYRDREALRVQNCLASLDQQSFRDFEVVFVDYGSQPERASEIKEICNTFPNVRHFYFDSRGQFWNPALALNYAIAQAKGETVLVLDVDLMVLPDFLEKCQKTHQVIEFLTFDYVDLKPGFTQYAQLASQKEVLIQPKQIKPVNGALLLARQFLLAAGGYDPYFFIWGELDLEILDRLEALGLQNAICRQQISLCFINGILLAIGICPKAGRPSLWPTVPKTGPP